MGDTVSQVLSSDWYPQRFPYQPQPWDCGTDGDAVEGDASGAPIPGYDAPGQHIEDASAGFWPQARYIQYRVNFFTRDSTRTPELYNLAIYFEGEDNNNNGGGNNGPGTNYFTFLPLVLK